MRVDGSEAPGERPGAAAEEPEPSVAAFADLPPEAPLDMPTQSLRTRERSAPVQGPVGIRARRAIVFSATAMLAAAACASLFDMFQRDGLTNMEILGLALFVPLFAGISCWFCSAAAGFIVLLSDRADALANQGPTPIPTTRTALLAPVFNEDVRAVFARLRAMDGSLDKLGLSHAFDLFILSDTNDPEIAAVEQQAFREFKRGAAIASYYRQRLTNTQRKAGNIGDWVRRFGGSYQQMIVLDADSLMTGDALARLVSIMEQRPDIGLVQSLPRIINAETVFARYLQFGVRLYGRVAATGLAWWSGAEGSYWGHNAVVRVRAFAETAGLPRLAGIKPFGGDIMSHDVVEAALMRRGGWGVHFATLLDGSFEESPPTLVDFSARDRRWCQGNLQHMQVLFAGKGLHWVSRLQLLMGFVAYLMSLLWLVFLSAGVALRLEGLQDAIFVPSWLRRTDGVSATLIVTVLTTILLVGPKLMGAALIMLRPAERRAFGGAGNILRGLAVEMLISAALAPILMFTQTKALAEIFTGRDAGWTAQRRHAHAVSWSEAARIYGWQSFLGVVLLLSFAADLDLLLWTSPILMSLACATPIAVLTSSRSLGLAMRRAGLMLTPEERFPPAIARQAARARAAASAPQRLAPAAAEPGPAWRPDRGPAPAIATSS